MKIKSSIFPFSFFLSDRIIISDIVDAAKKYGGATKNIKSGVAWSNIPGTEYLTINENKNIISLFIPSTVDVDRVNEEKQREVFHYVMKRLRSLYHDISVDPAIGTWWDTDKQGVVTEDVLLVSVETNQISISDIWFFVGMARFIKKEMRQQGVSIAFNDALAIV